MIRDPRQSPAEWGEDFPLNLVAANDNVAAGGRGGWSAWRDSWLAHAPGATGEWERRRVNASSLIRHSSDRQARASACW
ncbi:MAG: hypothetical protein JWN93_2665 [Hyphomicrobiales bacterium]|nr:hypothetical protein [Hyphomicrobiales bacterium]